MFERERCAWGFWKGLSRPRLPCARGRWAWEGRRGLVLASHPAQGRSSQLCGRHSWACSLIFRNGTRAAPGAQSGQALRPSAWALPPRSKHPHQPEGASQAWDLDGGGNRGLPRAPITPERAGLWGRRCLGSPDSPRRAPSQAAPRAAPRSRSFLLLQVLPRLSGSTPLAGGPARPRWREGTPGSRAQAGWPSHSVSAGRLTGRLRLPSRRLPSPHLTPRGFLQMGLVFPWGVKEPQVIAGASSPPGSWLRPATKSQPLTQRSQQRRGWHPPRASWDEPLGVQP